MSYISLTGGAYQARSIIASAQRCLNLYVEATPQSAGEPLGFTHYPTPGLSLVRPAPEDICRCLYRASNGDLYACYGQSVYFVADTGLYTLVGTFTPSATSDATPRTTPVSMADNGTTMIIVDGSVDGWTVDLVTRSGFTRLQSVYSTTGIITAGSVTIDNVLDTTGIGVGVLISGDGIPDDTTVASVAGNSITITHPATKTTKPPVPPAKLHFTTGFYGADFVCYLDTFFVLNKPGTSIFYVSNSEDPTFDPIDFASKVTMADQLVAVVTIHSVLVMLGQFSWESWQNTGGDGTTTANFPFSRLPGNFGNWGCVAKYSIANSNNTVWWLSQDQSGRGMVMQGDGYASKRVSTHAIEVQIASYPTINDAIAYTYQQQGHVFYVLNFPSANDHRGATWCYDSTTDQWHERAWIDANGIEHRHRGSFAVEAYGRNFVGDWQGNELYTFDLTNFTDNGAPIKRLRSFPHQIDTQGNRRVMYHQLIGNFQVGSDSAGGSGPPTEIIDTKFIASSGTLLQNFANYQDIGATFTKESGINAQIVSDAVTSADSGTAVYEASGTPTLPDYTVSFNVLPSDYLTVASGGSQIFAIARADVSDNGYQAIVQSTGSAYEVILNVMPSGSSHTVAMGTLVSGFYRVSLTLIANSISVAVYRSRDGLWLTPDATWSGIRATAITVIDSTYATPGRVLIGGTWI